MTNEATASDSKLTFTEVLDSLTGYDEQAIEQRFGGDINTLLRTNATKASRSLVYILLKRENEAADTQNPDGKAYKKVMGIPMAEITDYFGDDVDEIDENSPVTESGKDDEQPA